MDAAGLGLQGGVDVVDAVAQGGREQALEGRHHQGLGGMAGEFALEAHLQLFHITAGQLAE